MMTIPLTNSDLYQAEMLRRAELYPSDDEQAEWEETLDEGGFAGEMLVVVIALGIVAAVVLGSVVAAIIMGVL